MQDKIIEAHIKRFSLCDGEFRIIVELEDGGGVSVLTGGGKDEFQFRGSKPESIAKIAKLLAAIPEVVVEIKEMERKMEGINGS
jgi:hypothetical protein